MLDDLDRAARGRLARHRLLTADEERALAQRVAAGRGNPALAADAAAARDELVRCNARLVFHCANGFFSSDAAIEFDDLVQEGMLGLLRAADLYDPHFGALCAPAAGPRFTTFAIWWIRHYIRRLVETSGPMRLPANWRTASNHLRPALEAARQVRSLDAPLRDPHDASATTLAETVSDDSNTEGDALDAVLAEQILNALGETQRQALVLLCRDGMLHRDIGRALGRSHAYTWYAIQCARKVAGVSP